MVRLELFFADHALHLQRWRLESLSEVVDFPLKCSGVGDSRYRRSRSMVSSRGCNRLSQGGQGQDIREECRGP